MMMNISRREFLKKSGGTMSVIGFLGLPLSGCINSSKKVIVGAHPWVYAAPLPEYDITPVLDIIFSDMKYAGLDGVELMHNPLRSAEATLMIGELKEKHGLPVIGTSYGGNMWDRTKHPEIIEDAENVILNLEKVGGRTMGISVGNARHKKTEEELDAQAELLTQLLKFGKEHGVILNLHNHTYEVEDNMHDLRGILKRIPDFPLGPDLNWCIRGGVDPLDYINEFGDRMVFVHLRNQYVDGSWSESLAEGDMDHASIGKALKEKNFNGDLVIELAHERDFNPTRPIRESLKMSRDFIREVMGY
ncbi:sugar phosphate isomerase/epimerase family protein [Bacteroidota bacterium]